MHGDTVVEVRKRSGAQLRQIARAFFWRHFYSSATDIVAYRILDPISAAIPGDGAQKPSDTARAELPLYQWALDTGLIDPDLSGYKSWVTDYGNAEDSIRAFAQLCYVAGMKAAQAKERGNG